jgi:hypothetical protein
MVPRVTDVCVYAILAERGIAPPLCGAGTGGRLAEG